MKYDAIVVGGGIAGLTAAAYVANSGHSVRLFEKADKIGGLVNSFEYKGFVFDGGIRATEDLGILLPMLKQLGIEVDFTENIVSIGIEDKIVNVTGHDSLYDYQDMLAGLFPENKNDIQKIIDQIKKIMGYMDIQYGIENPVFKDIKNDKEYLMETLLPWFGKYIMTIGKVNKLTTPIEEYLATFTDNQALIDIIAQHFFTNTPAYFALSYFTLYLDYIYPVGGTGNLPYAINDFILENGGEVQTEKMIVEVNPQDKYIKDSDGNVYYYKQLIWAADMKYLYDICDIEKLPSNSQKNKAKEHKQLMQGKVGGDSVYSVYVTCKIDVEYFKSKHGAHVFYTPVCSGLNNVSLDKIKNSKGDFTDKKDEIIAWLYDYYKYTTYEIAIPAVRDASLAPYGKTGLIVSTLMEYSLVKHIEYMGWYEEFKKMSQELMIEALTNSIYPELKEKIEDIFSASPLTIKKTTGNTDGALTGWAFTNDTIPAVSKLTAIAQSVKTKIPDVYQAGQWTFSPAGLPISIITGKMAADKVIKKLKRK